MAEPRLVSGAGRCRGLAPRAVLPRPRVRDGSAHRRKTLCEHLAPDGLLDRDEIDAPRDIWRTTPSSRYAPGWRRDPARWARSGGRFRRARQRRVAVSARGPRAIRLQADDGAPNPRPSAWEADALPTELRPRVPGGGGGLLAMKEGGSETAVGGHTVPAPKSLERNNQARVRDSSAAGSRWEYALDQLRRVTMGMHVPGFRRGRVVLASAIVALGAARCAGAGPRCLPADR